MTRLCSRLRKNKKIFKFETGEAISRAHCMLTPSSPVARYHHGAYLAKPFTYLYSFLLSLVPKRLEFDNLSDENLQGSWKEFQSYSLFF